MRRFGTAGAHPPLPAAINARFLMDVCKSAKAVSPQGVLAPSAPIPYFEKPFTRFAGRVHWRLVWIWREAAVLTTVDSTPSPAPDHATHRRMYNPSRVEANASLGWCAYSPVTRSRTRNRSFMD